MPKKKILVVGSLTHDFILRPRHNHCLEEDGHVCFSFELGEKIRICEKHETFGGGAANVAVGLARFCSADPAVLGAIGDDQSAKRILHHLEHEGVDTHFVQKTNGNSGFSTVLSEKSGERTVLFFSGANAEFIDFEESILDQFDGIALEHLSSGAEKVFTKIAHHFQKFPHKFLSWSPGKEALEKGISAFSELFPTVDLLILNREEAEVFTQEKTIEDIFRAFFVGGLGGVVIVTDGRNGAYACDRKTIFSCPVDLDSPRVDTLGAGDGFLSGALGAIFLGKDLPTTLKYATINAAGVVSHFGAQFGLLSRENIETKISEITVTTQNFSLSK